MPMKIDDILEVIVDLSHSQGFWGRLYEWMMELKENDPEGWATYVETLEAQKFKDTLDVVLFFEQ